LDRSHSEWKDSVIQRGKNAEVFYNDFFKDLIINNGPKQNDPNFKSEIINHIKQFFLKDELSFLAIDGSNDKHKSAEFLSFYGGAYGAKGTLSLSDNPPKIKYKKWDISKDVTMVAFVPIPYSQLGQIINKDAPETFVVTDKDAIDISSLDLPMMQLAEIFLACDSISQSSLDSPDLIMIDNNVSGILGSTDFRPTKVGLVGYPSQNKNLTLADLTIAQAHPFNKELNIPDARKGNEETAPFALLHLFHENHVDYYGKDVKISDIEKTLKIPPGKFPLVKLRTLKEREIIDYDSQNKTITLKINVSDSWAYTKYFFTEVCRKIFIEKKTDSLMYDTKDEYGNPTKAWMAPNDIGCLIGIGTRILIEESWKQNILLVGVVKDSASQYLKKHYLSVCKMLDVYQNLTKDYKFLPPTDRMLCEALPYIDDTIESPWATIEFDSAFMTLRAAFTDSPNNTQLIAISSRGGLQDPSPFIRPERLFLRSIAQFYTKRKNGNLLSGHSVFVDRLVHPRLDSRYSSILHVPGHSRIGTIDVIHYKDNGVVNLGQQMTLYLLSLLTKNHYPNVIGHPDPLHKADLGAKAIKDNIKKLLISSEYKFRSDPLTNTLREIRDTGGKGRR